MTHHAVWPEGRPDEAFHTTSPIRAIVMRMRLHARNLAKPARARRTRHATCAEGAPVPQITEAVLERLGAIVPPGGWPHPSADPSLQQPGDVHVVTHSVV